MIDTSADLDGCPCLATVRLRTMLDVGQPALARGGSGGAAGNAALAELMAASAAERALTVALACARSADRYRWSATIDVARIMAATVWDLFPQVIWRTGGQGEQ